MLWTILWFENQKSEWMRRAARSELEGKEGHEAYAFKQVEMWDRFAKEGRKRFAGKMVTATT